MPSLKSKHTKVNISFRLPVYELERAKKLANQLKIKFSDYMNMITHDSNDKFEEKLKCAK